MPWATFLPPLILLPFMMSGAVRYEYGVGFETALAMPGALAVMLLGWVWTYGLPSTELAQSRVVVVATFVSALILVMFTFELWWTPLFGGLPNTFEGVDIGNHLLIYQRFVKPDEHRQYAGFVSMYALMHWYRVFFASKDALPNSYYDALRFVHYAFLLAVPLALPLVLYPVLARVRGVIRASIASVLCLPLLLAALGFLIFPVVQYYQAEGFFSQIAGLYPLVLGFLSYGLIEHAGTRFILCCFWIVVQRYTYGLNLGDLLLALAYLWLWDARSIRAWWLRWGAWLFVPVAVYASYRVLRRLLPLRIARGYFIMHPSAWVVGGMVLMSALLLIAPSVFRQRGVEVSAASERFWRYAGVHGMATGLLMAIYFACDAPNLYYIQKFSLYATVLLALACVGPIATLLVHVLEHGPRWLLVPDHARFVWGATALTAVALFAALQGYVVYRPMARERWLHTAPSAALYSNYEPEVEAFFAKTLAEHKNATFGGYYDAFWPRMFTHNGLHFLFSHTRDHFFNFDFLYGKALFYEARGMCFFVLGTPDDFVAGPNTELLRQIRGLYGRHGDCTSFHPRWSERALSICSTCL